MSNISRRKFLKGAGVAALAVAAAGVLAGCSGNTDVPDKPTPGVPDKTVRVYYLINVQPVNGEPVEITVNGLATYVTYETIQKNIPAEVAADYDCANQNYDIGKDGTVKVVLQQKKAPAKTTKPVEIKYYEGTKPVGGTNLIYSLEVDEEASVVNLSKLELEKTDYKLADGNDGKIQKTVDGKLYVEVYVQAK